MRQNRRYHYLTTIHPLIDQKLQHYLKGGEQVIDATLGNGHDAYKLAKLIGPTGSLVGFDIQKEAIAATQKRLASLSHPPKIQLHCHSHADLPLYIDEPVDLIIYNLGYLPGGDKSITTEAESTLKSIQEGLALLKPNGLILIAIYHGHKAGAKERDKLLCYLSSLDQRYFHLLKQQFINQRNNPPFLLTIEKAAATPFAPNYETLKRLLKE